MKYISVSKYPRSISSVSQGYRIKVNSRKVKLDCIKQCSRKSRGISLREIPAHDLREPTVSFFNINLSPRIANREIPMPDPGRLTSGVLMDLRIPRIGHLSFWRWARTKSAGCLRRAKGSLTHRWGWVNSESAFDRFVALYHEQGFISKVVKRFHRIDEKIDTKKLAVKSICFHESTIFVVGSS